eukprot:7354649-Ditylum_brightwellii.AAC.1
MSFGLGKCTILLIKNGEYSTTNIYPEIPKLYDAENEGYHYLSTMERVNFHVDEVKSLTIKEYILRSEKSLMHT